MTSGYSGEMYLWCIFQNTRQDYLNYTIFKT